MALLLDIEQMNMLSADYFVFGVGNYLLIITSRIEVGKYLGFPVYRVTSMNFLSCNELSKLSSAQEVRFCSFASRKKQM